MRIFISSVIGGLSPFRDAARRAIQQFSADQDIDISIFMSEHETSTPRSPIDNCRNEVARSDIVIGLYGWRYGFVDAETQRSMTHLETLWALDDFAKPLLAYMVGDGMHEPAQAALIERIRDARLGVITTEVVSPDQLRYELYRALHSRLPTITKQCSAVNLRNKICATDLTHLALPLRCGRSMEALRIPTSDDDELLDVVVQAALRDGVDIVFVLGEVGAGKTWFLKRLFCDSLDAQLAGSSMTAVAFVDLTETLVPGSDPSWPWNWDALLDPAAGGPELVLLDGYDEAVAKSRPGSRLRLLESIVAVARDGRQVVVTSRSHLFETAEHLSRLIKAASARRRALGKAREQSLEHAVLFVKPLRDADLRTFLRNRYRDDADGLWQRMAAVVDLPDLAKRPVLLPMVCESLSDLEDMPGSRPITAGHLYRIYTEQWLSREAWRLGLGPDTARRFFESLALHFHNTMCEALLFDEFPTTFPEFFPPGRLSSEREGLVERLRAASVLTNGPSGLYEFAHRSFLEYFLAERIVHAITHGEQALVLDHFPSKVTDGFVVDLLRQEIGWEDELLSLIARADEPIVRYLAAYLTNRVASQPRMIDPEVAVRALRTSADTERNPFVMRELLVTMTSLGYDIDGWLEYHLADPVPRDVIEAELRDYYGSLEEARSYLLARLAPPTGAPLRLFYLISLASIAGSSDKGVLMHYASCGTRHESEIARAALQAIDVEECLC